jgi:hypothetical protein
MTRRRVALGTAVVLLLAGLVWVGFVWGPTGANRTPPPAGSAAVGGQVITFGSQTVAVVALVVAALSLLVAVLLYRGRRALLRAPTYLWPEDHARLLVDVTRTNREAATTLSDLVSHQATSAGELAGGMAQLRSAFVTMHNALDQREKEIATLRAGYETIVVKRIARRLLGVAQLLETRTPDRDPQETINSAVRLMEDLLEELGVTRFEPPVGAKYPSVVGVEDGPEEQPTNHPDADLTVAEVIQPGYRIEQADKTSTVLKQARVRIYRYAETGA